MRKPPAKERGALLWVRPLNDPWTAPRLRDAPGLPAADLFILCTAVIGFRPACRLIMDLAPARALLEPNREPCADLLAPARVEERGSPAVVVARVIALTLVTVPFAFVT
ncbi:hypothetical protein SBDP1_680039 [Syntrophobacter sp. SbD1]|nr:hypothetical protein SBDP1_680039 [Syntrophobacter sp. SbD1]